MDTTMFDQAKQTSIDLAVQFGPKLLVALILIAFGMIAGKWTAGMTARAIRRFGLEPPLQRLLARLVHVFVVALFAVMALQNIGIQLLPLLAGLGLAGAGVALAMQGVLSNVVAGLTVIFTKPFLVGQYISVVGEEGRVESINLFNTVLSHADRSQVVIPNRKVVGEILHNYGSIRQITVTASVSREADLDGALAAVADILKNSPRVLKEPAPLVLVGLQTPVSIDIQLRPWVSVLDYEPAASDLAQAIVETFRARGIPGPVPRNEVRMLEARTPEMDAHGQALGWVG